MKYFWHNLKKYSYFIIYSAKSELRSEVANSYLNWIWWVLEPLLNMLVFSFVFGTIFGMKEPYYPIFIFSGLIIWNFFNRIVNSSVKLIRANKGIVTKIYVPKFVLLLEKMAVSAYKMFFSVIVLVIMIIVYRMPITWKVLYVIPLMIGVFILTFAIGVILLHFGVFIDDLGYAINILLRLVMYLSGVMYNIDKRLDEHLATLLKTINPLAMLIDGIHDVLMYDGNMDIGLFSAWLVISVLISIIGLWIIHKYENSYVKVI